MDIKALKLFLAVYDAGNISGAAHCNNSRSDADIARWQKPRDGMQIGLVQ
ncbi:LysR family transcriptional regulator [Marinovum sp. 2_MG-2023]|nr:MULTISPECIES: LysR family transcriptional regulator [unclassified Marinovum]MDO6732268.1 LysR family transcriptional regulator [Marinovum sp. 2_MG-2023]MDO6781585.1 LysR family transcriptional regulator [Marinovum sp. 1_MG-2023]